MRKKKAKERVSGFPRARKRREGGKMEWMAGRDLIWENVHGLFKHAAVLPVQELSRRVDPHTPHACVCAAAAAAVW